MERKRFRRPLRARTAAPRKDAEKGTIEKIRDEKGTLWFIGMLIRVGLIGLVLIALWAGFLKFMGFG